jgi:hypothetical protein
MLLKYYCELSDNLVHLLFKIVEMIMAVPCTVMPLTQMVHCAALDVL